MIKKLTCYTIRVQRKVTRSYKVFHILITFKTFRCRYKLSKSQ
jgi:hypothetical protein